MFVFVFERILIIFTTKLPDADTEGVVLVLLDLQQLLEDVLVLHRVPGPEPGPVPAGQAEAGGEHRLPQAGRLAQLVLARKGFYKSKHTKYYLHDGLEHFPRQNLLLLVVVHTQQRTLGLLTSDNKN